ncbi:hypothetical protein [Helicobacter suis]|uniref:hypothetical protein n=1 Tax=Helicobacter suis TaxID=104628 RepID=UPI0013D613A9|nr:hypothetical protein [Helicobacter suis]
MGITDARFNLARLRDKNNLILDLLKLEIKEFVEFFHMTGAIIHKRIMGEQESLEQILDKAITMDRHQRK